MTIEIIELTGCIGIKAAIVHRDITIIEEAKAILAENGIAAHTSTLTHLHINTPAAKVAYILNVNGFAATVKARTE